MVLLLLLSLKVGIGVVIPASRGERIDLPELAGVDGGAGGTSIFIAKFEYHEDESTMSCC